MPVHQSQNAVEHLFDEIGHLTFAAPELQELAPTPAALRAEARNIAIVLKTGSPLQDYIASLQAKPFAITLDYAFDPQGEVLHLNALEIEGAALGRFQLSARLSGADIGQFRAWSLPRQPVLVEQMTLHFGNIGLMETFVVPPLLGALLADDQPPEPQVETAKASITDRIAATMKEPENGPSLDALTRFIGEFPHPERTLSLSISSKRTIALTDFSALFVGGDWDGFLNKFTAGTFRGCRLSAMRNDLKR